MASVVDICNTALAAVGEAKIADITEANARARACNTHYHLALDEALRDHPWNCVAARASLPVLSSTPAWGFAYEYQQPADCLRVNSVEDETIIFKVEGRKILTDASPPLNILYNRRPATPGEIDPLLANAIGLRLAIKICDALTKSDKVRKRVQDEYLVIRGDAVAVDAQEGTPDDLSTNEWVQARSG